MHWSELIGGDVVISPPHVWQKRFNSCDVEIRPRIDTSVSSTIVDVLLRKFEAAIAGHLPASRVEQILAVTRDPAALDALPINRLLDLFGLD